MASAHLVGDSCDGATRECAEHALYNNSHGWGHGCCHGTTCGVRYGKPSLTPSVGPPTCSLSPSTDSPCGGGDCVDPPGGSCCYAGCGGRPDSSRVSDDCVVKPGPKPVDAVALPASNDEPPPSTSAPSSRDWGVCVVPRAPRAHGPQPLRMAHSRGVASVKPCVKWNVKWLCTLALLCVVAGGVDGCDYTLSGAGTWVSCAWVVG